MECIYYNLFISSSGAERLCCFYLLALANSSVNLRHLGHIFLSTRFPSFWILCPLPAGLFPEQV